MNNIKLVLTDLDGMVAMSGAHTVSDAVRDFIVECEDNGVQVIPVTGRPYGMALSLINLLGFNSMGIFDNGATIQDCKTGEIIWRKWMEPDLIKQVASICAPYAEIIDFTEDHAEHEPADNELEIISEITEPTSHVYALITMTELDKVRRLLDQVEGITYYTAVSTKPAHPNARGIQINHVEADKFHGVDALRNIMGVPIEQTLAIGDGDNDIALFQNANLKVAMGNATDKLKLAANKIVGTISNDGFVDAMNELVLIK